MGHGKLLEARTIKMGTKLFCGGELRIRGEVVNRQWYRLVFIGRGKRFLCRLIDRCSSPEVEFVLCVLLFMYVSSGLIWYCKTTKPSSVRPHACENNLQATRFEFRA